MLNKNIQKITEEKESQQDEIKEPSIEFSNTAQQSIKDASQKLGNIKAPHESPEEFMKVVNDILFKLIEIEEKQNKTQKKEILSLDKFLPDLEKQLSKEKIYQKNETFEMIIKRIDEFQAQLSDYENEIKDEISKLKYQVSDCIEIAIELETKNETINSDMQEEIKVHEKESNNLEKSKKHNYWFIKDCLEVSLEKCLEVSLERIKHHQQVACESKLMLIQLLARSKLQKALDSLNNYPEFSKEIADEAHLESNPTPSATKPVPKEDLSGTSKDDEAEKGPASKFSNIYVIGALDGCDVCMSLN